MQNQEKPSEKQRGKDLEDWSKEEKLQLLDALQQHRYENVSKLCECIPTKRREQIEEALEFYHNRAFPQTSSCAPTKRRDNPEATIPLAGWANLLTETNNLDELQTEIATALRLIAEFEDRPPSKSTDNFDFEKIYLMLADALEGKTLKEDKKAKALIERCLEKTALASKKCNSKQLIGSIDLTKRDTTKDNKPTKKKSLACVRALVAEKNYNPLNISEANCKLRK